MHGRMNLIYKHSILPLALGGVLTFSSAFLIADEEAKKSAAPPPQETSKEGYTINYNTVSIAEYIKFASKICNTNFIFNEADLPFTVSIVSDAPITPENVMATLIQTLRIHGLMLLEQDNNLVIHKSGTVRQPATLVFGDKTSKGAPIVTRLFRLKNANVDSVAAIVRPMISDEALLEVSRETRQLILTDATAVVDKIAALIENLDAPHSALEIRSFEAKFNKPEYLIELSSQIMNPLAQGNPFILVPQTLANTVFLVSTPELNEKAIAVLTNLDTPPKKTVLSERKIKSENIFVVKLEHRAGDEILKSLQEIASNLQGSGMLESDLLETIENGKWIRDTNSLMFVGSPESNVKIKEFINALDIGGGAEGAKASFFVYKPLNRSVEEIQKSMQEMADNLAKTKGAEENVIAAIRSQKINPLTHTILYGGDPAAFTKIKELLTTIDTPSAKGAHPQLKANFFVYKIQSAPYGEIEASLKSFAKSLESSGLPEEGIVSTINNIKYIKETNSLVFVGPDESLKRLQELLPQFDAGVGQQSIPPSTQFLAYKPKYQKGEALVKSLKETADSLQSTLSDPALLHSIGSMKWVKNTNTLLFTGDPVSLKRIDDLITTIDIQTTAAPKPGSERNFFLYKLQFASREKTDAYLQQLADHLNKINDADLIDAIHSMKWIEPSHSFVFSGTDNSLNRIKDLLKTFDTTAESQTAIQNSFFTYQPKFASQDKTEQYLNQLSNRLNSKSEADLIDAIHSIKWLEPSRSFMFNGSEPALNRIKDLLAQFDIQSAAVPSSFYLYPLKYAAQDKTEQFLNQITDNLSKKGGDQALISALQSKKWIPESQSFMFSGSDVALTKIKDLLANFDIPSEQQKPPSKTSYFVYKLQNPQGDQVEEDLENMLKNMKSTGLKDSPVVHVIENIRYVKETNSLLLTGDTAAIEEAKELIAKYDFARPASAPTNSNFYMYKPSQVPAAKIDKSLRDIGASLKKADLIDPNLLSTINSMKYVDTTNSFIFTGTPDAISKIQGLLKDIDIAAPHAPIHVGKTTFLLFKLKNASGSQISSSLKAISTDLRKSGTTDKEFLTALDSIKFVKETNSLMFTGPEESLAKVQALVEKFDVTSLAAPISAPKPEKEGGPTDFFVYKVQALSGPDLEKTLSDFAENLKVGGLNDPGLFNTLQSVKYIDKTQSLVFTGDHKSLERVKGLLKDFDIPANLPMGPNGETSIQSIDNTSFLVYKLEFHKGDEIQGALRQIAKDLILTSAPVNQNLLNSINSIQWLEVTNSLLCSGEQETLTRLRELVKNLDIPLKQVFIEVLVIETTLGNALTFGLEWGGKVNYQNRVAASFNNFPPVSGFTSYPSGSFESGLGSINATTTPNPNTMIPFAPNFETGVIGDIIKHNGKSFISLGSLMNALESDVETSIVMTPKIIAQDSKTATIFVGRNVPFAGSFISNAAATTVTTSNLEYRDIGMNLSITPVLGNSDIITMDISLDESAIVANSTGASISFGNNVTAQGITSSRTTMQTTVHVPNKHFLVLSGMVNNTNQRTKTGIPCLGGIPIIGAAFSTDNVNSNNDNIVIFMRPTIINSLEEMKELSANQEEAHRNQAGTPALEHEFDEGMELIKSPEDE